MKANEYEAEIERIAASDNPLGQPLLTEWGQEQLALWPRMLRTLEELVYFHDTDDTPNSDPWQNARNMIHTVRCAETRLTGRAAFPKKPTPA